MSDPTRKYDLYSDAFKADAYATFARMRRDDPILCQPGLDGRTMIWFVSRYQDVDAILRDSKRFVRDEDLAHDPDQLRPRSQLEMLVSNHMLNKDGHDHRRLRSLVSLAFTPKRVEQLRPRIEAIAAELLGRVAERREMDLIADFAFHLPTIVILEMLGIPVEDRDKFRVWSNVMLEPAMDEAGLERFVTLMTEFTAYLRALFAERRQDPRDDLVSALLQAEEAGDRLSEDELYSTVVLLIVAGHETTVNLIGNAVLALLRNPEQFAALRADPGLIAGAVEEFLRFDGSVERALNRWAAEDVEFRGHLIRRGDPVILLLGAANHDPERFDDPETLDLRRHPNPHLGFGKGPHYCLGAPLARLETAVALEALLRLPNLRLAAPEAELRWRPIPGFKGLVALPLRWD